MVEMTLRAPAPPPGLRPGSLPRLSVLIPAYNTAATIGAAVESALVQSPPPFEIIVSDDGSHDDLQRALQPYRERVRVVRGTNAGLAAARNRAAAVAGGEMLALLDADDTWLPGRVAALTEAAAARPDLAVLTTDAVVVSNGKREPLTYYATRDFFVDDQEIGILRNSFVFGAGAIRAAAFRSVGGYRAGARHAEDWDLWLRMLLGGHRAGLIQAPLYEYRRRADSLTGQRVELALGVLDVLTRARALVSSHDQRRQLELTIQRWKEIAARSAGCAEDHRARGLALRAAAGSCATARARVRFATAVILPRRVLPRRGRLG